MKVEEIMKLFMHLRLINLATLLFVLSSCGTYDYIASGFSSEEEAVEEISKAEDELRSDLQDYVDSGGDVSESVSEEVNQTNDEEVGYRCGFHLFPRRFNARKGKGTSAP